MKRVLFVDVRNATRSQIAEAWFNHLAGNCGKAASCGTLPAERIGVRAMQVMFEQGIDISGKSPQRVTQRMLDQAHIVVFMETGIYPRVRSGIRLWNFQDPAGKPLDQVRELRDQICRRVEQLIAEIALEDAMPPWVDWDKSLPMQLQPVWN